LAGLAVGEVAEAIAQMAKLEDGGE
jgi:hypothetical protein